MQTRSSLQRRSSSDWSNRLVASLKPPAWRTPPQQQDQPQQLPYRGYDLSKVDLFSHDPGPRTTPNVMRVIQAKLKVGAPNDVYEQEADRVAEQVMSTPDASVQQQPEGSISSGNSPTIQCEEDQELASAIDQGKAVPDTLSALKDITYGKTADSAVSTGMNVAGAALDFGSNKAAGQSTGEAVGGAAGSFAASELVEYSPVDSTVKAANSVAKALGAPEAVTNSTQVASDMMPSSVVGSGLSNLGRGIFNAVTGNTKALDKQFTDVADGKSGAVFQGYALAPQVAAGIATGDAESAFLKVGSQGKNSPIAKIGGWLGEKAYELLHKDESVQPKLAVGQQGDQYEQEADRMAEQVMNTPETATQPSVQREATEDNQTKPSLQRSTDGSLQADSDLEGQLNSSNSGGSPLPDEVRSFMEPRFGADFSQVRVHTGNEAVQMNQDLHAQAFTHKQDVYFGAGKTPAKDALTAHELTHVVQQAGGIQMLQLSSDDQSEESWLDRGIDWAEGKVASGAHALADKAKGIPIVEQAANAGAFVAEQGSQYAGGLLKGAGTMASGIGNMVAHPVDTAMGLEAMAEHIPVMGAPLKAMHGVYDVAVNGKDPLETANHVLNPFQSLKDDASFYGNVAKGIAKPYQKEIEQGKYAEAAGRGVFDIGSIVLTAGAGAGAEGAAAAGRGAAIAGEAADAARIAESAAVASDAAKVAEGAAVAGDAARVAEGTAVSSDATKAAEVADAAKVTSEVDDASKIATGVDQKSASSVGGFTDGDIDQLLQNLDEGNYSTGPYGELPAAKNPGVSEGLKDIKVKFDETKPIAYHENLKFKGIEGAPGGKDVQYRYHSANKGAPEGKDSHENPTVQIDNKNGFYKLPDGTWKKMSDMTEAEKDAAHYR